MKKSWVLNIAKAILGTIILFAMLEGILSLLNLGHVENYRGFGYSNKCCGDLRPNQEFVSMMVKDHPFLVKTNNLGFRNNNDTKIEKEKTRIIVVGDSLTFGPYLSNEETYPYYLEQDFSGKVEVLNSGIPSYTITTEKDYIMEKAYKMKPDAILLQFFPNDITDMGKNSQRLRKYYPIIGPMLNFARDKSHTFALMVDIIKNRKVSEALSEKNKTFEREMEIRYNTSFDNEYYQEYKRQFAEVVSFTKNKGIALFVLVAPEIDQVENANLNNPNKFMKGLCDEYNVKCLDLMDAFIKYNDTELLYLVPWNTHLSKYGNMLAAKEINKFLIKNGFN